MSEDVIIDSANIGNSSDDGYNRKPDGKFGSGNKGCPPGRATGTTQRMKKFLTDFVEDKAPEIYDIWDKLTPKEKAALFMHIVKYVMPEPRQADSDTQQEIIITLKEAEPKKS